MKKIILIWYNPNSDKIYTQDLEYGVDLYLNDYNIGYTNQYGHFIINILVILEDSCISCSNYYDYYSKISKYNKIYNIELERLNNYLFYGKGAY